MQLEKFKPLQNDVIFVDGLWGTGKSILGPILSGMEGVEKQKMAEIFEYVCILHYLGKISDDAAATLLLTYADIHQYHNFIGREVNLRWTDASGPMANPNGFRYFKRLIGGEGEEFIDKINLDNIALTIMSHQILPISLMPFKIFGKRLRFIEMVRHPIYIVTHWTSYLNRFLSTKEFTLSFNLNNTKVPWFASEMGKEYLETTEMDRALMSISYMYKRLFAVLDTLKGSDQLFVLSFESVVFDTASIMGKLEIFLNRRHHKKLNKLLRIQKIPRDTIMLGTGFNSYGWKQQDSLLSEKEFYLKQLDSIQKNVTEKTFTEFQSLIHEYNRRWPSRIEELHPR